MPHKLVTQIRDAELSWKKDALCRNMPPNFFYPVGQSRAAEAQTEQAQRVCHECPVKDECLEYAVTNNERHGVWGGESEKSRMTIMRQRGLIQLRPNQRKGEWDPERNHAHKNSRNVVIH